MTDNPLERFVRDHTVTSAVPFVPEVTMHVAAEAIPLWEKTEAARGETNLAPPFWAFPWAGGQGLARYVLDHPEIVRDRVVLDLAAGGGLVAIAAALAGASRVTANEIDSYADAAIALNAAANGIAVERLLGDLLDSHRDTGQTMRPDVVLAGDVFYSRDMSDRVLAFLRRVGAATVLVGDPGRAYAPAVHGDVTRVAAYDVPVIRDLEDMDVKRVYVLRIGGATGSG